MSTYKDINKSIDSRIDKDTKDWLETLRRGKEVK